MVRSRTRSGFMQRYLSGTDILDIGYKGYLDGVVPIVPAAAGIDLDTPGYDGRILPVPAQSQDAVFASHCLEHVEDSRHAIRDWFRVLRVGGFLIIMVPHQFLYEKRAQMPSRYNADHKRFYTPASLMAEVEAALDPNTYRLRHLSDNDEGFDYGQGPDSHSGGSYEIEIVVEKIEPPAWQLDAAPLRGSLDAPFPLPHPHPAAPAALATAAPGGLAVKLFEFGTNRAEQPRILVLALGHLGDYIIGLPSLRRLRDAFPRASIRLVVGSWNRSAAEACGLVDEVATYDFFPPNGRWDGRPFEPLPRFAAAAEGAFALAVDLRVDEDTRMLLAGVDARLRCGIGVPGRFPFLDVVMPPEHVDRRDTTTRQRRLLSPGEFTSRMPVQTPFYHETSLVAPRLHMIYGPHVTLPVGGFTASFALQLTGWSPPRSKPAVTIDVARDGEIVAVRRLGLRDLRAATVHTLAFGNADLHAQYEFRVFVEGRSALAGVRFGGVDLVHVDAPVRPRFRPATLHIGEQLSALVQLVADRTQALYDPAPPTTAQPASRRSVVLAPLSNSDLRDWPAAHYAALVRHLLEETDVGIALVGAPHQAGQLEVIRQQSGSDPRVENLAGRTAWSDMPALLRAAALVVCNNSGIAHAAAAAGARTLAVYAGSHQPQEWGPRGARSRAIMAVVPCSPCGLDRLSDCPHHHACMQGLTPATVFAHAKALLDE